MTRYPTNESALDSLEADSVPPPVERQIDKLYRPEVALLVKRVGRDLSRIAAATAVVASGSDPTEQFLEHVRERYNLSSDRDDEVSRELEHIASDSGWWTPIDSFGTVSLALAATGTLEASNGDSLADLVLNDQKGDAARLLVSTAYDELAHRGGQAWRWSE